jgi:hypothetical protein
MFAGGDGSFSDALSLMVNYSKDTDDPNSISSIPLLIPRIKYHQNSVAEIIKLCDEIGEPKLKELFEQFAGFTKKPTINEINAIMALPPDDPRIRAFYKGPEITPDQRRSITTLLKSDDIRVGLSRLAQNLANEHNFSRTIINYVESELTKIVRSKQLSVPHTSDNLS